MTHIEGHHHLARDHICRSAPRLDPPHRGHQPSRRPRSRLHRRHPFSRRRHRHPAAGSSALFPHGSTCPLNVSSSRVCPTIASTTPSANPSLSSTGPCSICTSRYPSTGPFTAAKPSSDGSSPNPRKLLSTLTPPSSLSVKASICPSNRPNQRQRFPETAAQTARPLPPKTQLPRWETLAAPRAAPPPPQPPAPPPAPHRRLPHLAPYRDATLSAGSQLHRHPAPHHAANISRRIHAGSIPAARIHPAHQRMQRPCAASLKRGETSASSGREHRLSRAQLTAGDGVTRSRPF